MDYRQYVKGYDNFPKEGVRFWDFTYLLKDVRAREQAISEMKEFLKNKNITKIVAVEAKGFTIGSILAHELKLPLILIRKPNLIPGEHYDEKFIKEYGMGEYQIKSDALEKDDRCAIFYDIMAGSGATKACINLVERFGTSVEALLYVTELEYLNGREELEDNDIFSLVKVKSKND